jgi:hypothetical protein
MADIRKKKDSRFDYEISDQPNPHFGPAEPGNVWVTGPWGSQTANPETAIPWVDIGYPTQHNDLYSITLGGHGGTSEGDAWDPVDIAAAKKIVGNSPKITRAHVEAYKQYLLQKRDPHFMSTHPGKAAFLDPNAPPEARMTQDAPMDWQQLTPADWQNTLLPQQPQMTPPPFLPGMMPPQPGPGADMGGGADQDPMAGLMAMISQLQQRFPQLGGMPQGQQQAPNFNALVALQTAMQSPGMQGRYTPGAGAQIAQALLPLLAGHIQGPILKQQWEQQQAQHQSRAMAELIRAASTMMAAGTAARAGAAKQAYYAGLPAQKAQEAAQKFQYDVTKTMVELKEKERQNAFTQAKADARALLAHGDKEAAMKQRQTIADMEKTTREGATTVHAGADSLVTLDRKGNIVNSVPFTPKPSGGQNDEMMKELADRLKAKMEGKEYVPSTPSQTTTPATGSTTQQKKPQTDFIKPGQPVIQWDDPRFGVKVTP